MQVSVKKKINPEVANFIDTKATLPELIKRTLAAVEQLPPQSPKVEVEVQPQKVEQAPQPKKATPKRPSILSLQELLSGGDTQEVKQSETTKSIEPEIDPQSEQKLLDTKGEILKHIAQWRPRFLPFFEAMALSGSTISIVVPTSELKEEILRNRTELLTKVMELSKLKGGVDLAIEINEVQKSIKPIKLEDRIAHIMALNPLIVELKEALDLDVEG